MSTLAALSFKKYWIEKVVSEAKHYHATPRHPTLMEVIECSDTVPLLNQQESSASLIVAAATIG
jgi:hypothetical protein